MDLANELPGFDCYDDDENRVEIDSHYNWMSHKEKYSDIELVEMIGWIERQIINAKDNLPESNCPIVLPKQLNQHQLFAFNIVKEYLIAGKQLFLLL